jgi:hypothetical protein
VYWHLQDILFASPPIKPLSAHPQIEWQSPFPTTVQVLLFGCPPQVPVAPASFGLTVKQVEQPEQFGAGVPLPPPSPIVPGSAYNAWPIMPRHSNATPIPEHTNEHKLLATVFPFK